VPFSDGRPGLCVSIHDVAPETWPACERLLHMLNRLGVGPVTLLVVPDFHHRGGLARSPAFRRAIDARLGVGDEVALHGFFHRDDGRLSRTPMEWFRRQVLTAGEAEFAALSADQARARLAAGLDALHACGWPVHGFVAPAWQLGQRARTVLAEFPFEYTTTRTDIWRLPSWQRISALSLVYSVRGRVRRRLSMIWNDGLARRLRSDRLLRISLHPADAAFPDVLEHWRRLILSAARDREPVTKRGWVMRQP
jgi:predicted deacetylase